MSSRQATHTLSLGDTPGDTAGESGGGIGVGVGGMGVGVGVGVDVVTTAQRSVRATVSTPPC